MTYIVPWCANCGLPEHDDPTCPRYSGPSETVVHPPICARPGCGVLIENPRRARRPSPFCPAHRRERMRWVSRSNESRRRAHMIKPPPPPPPPPLPFAFDAIREWMPRDLRDGKKGATEETWWGRLAALYCAAHPGTRFSAARQRVGHLRGQYVDAFTADDWAVTLGVHPSEIWPSWDTAEDLIDDDLMLLTGSEA